MPDPTALGNLTAGIAHTLRQAAGQSPEGDALRGVRTPPIDPEQAGRDAMLRRALNAIPARFRDEAARVPRVITWAQQVAAGGTESLTLLGGVGVGKTSECYGAIRLILESQPDWGPDISMHSVPDLLANLRPPADSAHLCAVRNAKVLLLDDLAVEKSSPWTAEVLYRILDYRYRWLLPTIVTSNYGGRELSEHVGDRITSRLRGMGDVVVLEGPDRRRANA